MFHLLTLVGLALSITCSFSWGETLSLNQRFQLEKVSPGSGFSISDSFLDSKDSTKLLEILSQKHVVFVDGIMNELASIVGNYFKDNRNQIIQLGITYDHLRYSSMNSISSNADQLALDLYDISVRVNKPIILIGHSMGGAEVILAALKNPALFLSYLSQETYHEAFGKLLSSVPRIEKVISIQGAIGGSVLAGNLNFMGRTLLKHLLGRGLESLQRPVSRFNFQNEYFSLPQKIIRQFSYWGLNESQFIHEKLIELSQKTYFIRSAHHPQNEDLSWGLNIVLSFCESGLLNQIENDGLLTLDDQILGVAPIDGIPFGIDLGILEADHIELVVSGMVSHSSDRDRRAFTRALLQSIYQNPEKLLQSALPRKVWTHSPSRFFGKS